MIIIPNLPIPPSANEMHSVGASKVWRQRKDGTKYLSATSHVYNSPALKHFYLQCMSFKNINHVHIAKIRERLLSWISQGYVLKLEIYVAFEHSRVWTKDGQPQRIDADNRIKPMQDGLSKILDIDDCWVFSATIEKVTTLSKEYEQCQIKISPIKAKTLTEVQNIRNTEKDS